MGLAFNLVQIVVAKRLNNFFPDFVKLWVKRCSDCNINYLIQGLVSLRSTWKWCFKGGISFITYRLIFQIILKFILSDIKLRFHGYSCVHWSERHSSGTGKNKRAVTKHYTADELYFDHSVIVFGKVFINKPLNRRLVDWFMINWLATSTSLFNVFKLFWSS